MRSIREFLGARKLLGMTCDEVLTMLQSKKQSPNHVIRYNGYNMKFIGDPARDAEIKQYIDDLSGGK